MERIEAIVIGAGPAGLSAAVEMAKRGMRTVVFDENAKPGGQLFKQIHKFFGSKEHRARVRGFKIGEELLREAEDAGVKVLLNATVVGIYPEKEVVVRIGEETKHYKANAILIAAGASENAVTFPGWTLPGVIGAGAAQTMMNLYHMRPGKKVLMLGTGNVGLVVSYQLIQAGCEVVALVDALPRVGGYGVHAAKVARTGVPFYMNHTIVKAHGDQCVTAVTIGEIGKDGKIIAGSEKTFDVDTICLAVGLSPMNQLAKTAGVKMQELPQGDSIVCDENGCTSIEGIYAAGDVSGIEEASSAMIEGKITGITIAKDFGYIEDGEADQEKQKLFDALHNLRTGMFAPGNRGKKIEFTEEGIPVSEHLLKEGYLADEEVDLYPGITKRAGIHPVIECTQNIPCNPCQDVCPKKCIKVGKIITSLPQLDEQNQCTGCGMCVASCPGQAIFLVNESEQDATVSMPYEFSPLPEKDEIGYACGRNGEKLCEAQVVSVKNVPAFDQTKVLTIRVPKEYAMRARFYKRKQG